MKLIDKAMKKYGYTKIQETQYGVRYRKREPQNFDHAVCVLRKASGKDCTYCNVKEFNRGRWYCSNSEVSVFIPVPSGLPCFKPRKRGDG